MKDYMEIIQQRDGFIAALDQSGGSTPKALKAYGITEDQYETDAEMFHLVHAMRKRIMTSPAFTSDYILGAILFEYTMDAKVEDQFTADYLWSKDIIPFLKVDQGLDEESKSVQLMKPIPDLNILLRRAKERRIFGTKMRSVIRGANREGIKDIVNQQFEIGKQILDAGLVPIIEPEVDIHSPEKRTCETILKEDLLKQLDQLEEGQDVMLKLTIPTEANLYKELTEHRRVLRVVALSGGYPREQANALLKENDNVIASFSRALTEDLRAHQRDQVFDERLAESIYSIYQASID